MKKPQISTSLYIGIVTLLFIGAAIIWLTYSYFKQDKDVQFTKHQWIAIVDANQNRIINLASVIQGEDAIIVIDPDNKAYDKHLQALGLKHTLDLTVPFELSSLDTNKDYLISAEDPLYPYLLVLSFNPDSKNIIIVPFAKTNFRAIQLDKETNEHQVITSSSETLPLRDVSANGLSRTEPTGE